MAATTGALAINGAAPTVDRTQLRPWPEVERAHGIFAPNVTRFQDAWARRTGRRHCLAVNSGTSACHAALVAAGVGPGDEVITSSFSFSASGHAVALASATPVFGDIRPDTFELDAEKLRALVTPRTRAIMPVHVHGLVCDMNAHRRFAAANGLALVEDACQAAGATFDGQPAGSFGVTAAFSLNAAKPLQAGDGGMVVCDDLDALKAARRLAGLGEDRPRALTDDEERSYRAEWTGTNYRLHERVAEVALDQLDRLDGYLARARANADLLTRGLAGVPGVITPHVPADRKSSWSYYRVLLEPQVSGWEGTPEEYRNRIIWALRAEGVSRVGTWQRELLPQMPAFRRKAPQPWNPRLDDREALLPWDPDAFPVARDVLSRSLVLDWLHVQTEEYVRRVITAIHKVHQHLDEVLAAPHFTPLSVVPELTPLD